MNLYSDFEAAIFDFDGTLVNSLGVWQEADHIFLERRGIEMPESFYRAFSNQNLCQASKYIVEELHLPETAAEVEQEFLDIVAFEYAHKIEMVSGAGELLKKLKSANVKLAIATASQEALYRPCLERHGVYALFDCIVTTAEVTRTKGFPDVYLLAAERLGARPEKCVVFEDIYLGAVGAKAAGMSCVCLKEEHSKGDWGKLDGLADMVIDDFRELL